MTSNLNINNLKSDIINFKGIEKHDIIIPFIDFTINNTSNQLGTYPTVSSNIYYKHIILKNIDFINILNFDILIENIEKDFLIEAQKLGYKNRKNIINESEFDIILKNNNKSKDYVISKLTSLQHHFSKITRLGGVSFLASNYLTYMNIHNYLDLPFEYSTLKEKRNLNGIPYIINNCLDDDIILASRKNNTDNPGIHCYILTDKNKNVNIDIVDFLEFGSYNKKKVYRLYYKVDDIGLSPENQYFIIKTSDIQSIRCKKLNKIKSLYE